MVDFIEFYRKKKIHGALNMTIEELNIGAFQLRSGSDFKESFSIKKMSLEEVPTAPDQRKLQVYFKRKGLKTLSTRKNKPCTINNTEGCYSYECNVQYSGTPLDSCSAFDCYTNSDSGHLISHNTFKTNMDTLKNDINSKLDDIVTSINALSLGVTTPDTTPDTPTETCTGGRRIVSASKEFCRTSIQESWGDGYFRDWAWNQCTTFCASKPGGGTSFGGSSTCKQCKCNNGYTPIICTPI